MTQENDRLFERPASGRKKKYTRPHLKKDWAPPQIQTGKLFEASTVSCAKQPGNPPCTPLFSA